MQTLFSITIDVGISIVNFRLLHYVFDGQETIYFISWGRYNILKGKAQLFQCVCKQKNTSLSYTNSYTVTGQLAGKVLLTAAVLDPWFVSDNKFQNWRTQDDIVLKFTLLSYLNVTKWTSNNMRSCK